jgi:DUF2946 family protein
MKWFRSNLRTGSRLALLSLLIQFVLVFGHFHGFTAQAAPIAQSGPAQSDPGKIIGRGAADAADRWARQQQPSSDHDSGQSSGDSCAICATIALASTLLFATPPPLLVPSADADFEYQTTETEFVRLNSTAAAFQARGPPAS